MEKSETPKHPANKTQPRDTGRSFRDPKTKQEIRVIARQGESDDEAYARVLKHHTGGK